MSTESPNPETYIEDKTKSENMARAEYFDRGVAQLLQRSGETEKAELYLKRAGLKAEQVEQDWEQQEERMKQHAIEVLERASEGSTILEINAIFPELESNEWEIQRRAQKIFRDFFGIRSTHRYYDLLTDERGRERISTSTTDIDGMLYETRDPVDKEAGVSGPRSHVIHVLKQDDWQMELKKIDAAQKEYERKMAKPQT